MKTVTLKQDNRSIILEEDSVTVTVKSDHVARGDERIYGIHSGNVKLHSKVKNVPNDWAPSKYFYDGSNWTQNPDWVDPSEV